MYVLCTGFIVPVNKVNSPIEDASHFHLGVVSRLQRDHPVVPCLYQKENKTNFLSLFIYFERNRYSASRGGAEREGGRERAS